MPSTLFSPAKASRPACQRVESRASRPKARPLTRVQEVMLIGSVFAVGVFLQLIVVLNAAGIAE